MSADTISQEIQYFTQLRDAASASMDDMGSTPETRLYHQGKRDAYETVMGALTRLKSTIGNGGAQ